MLAFRLEGCSSTEQRLPFSRVPMRGRHEKNKYTANLPRVPKPCILHTWRGVYFLNVSLWTKSYSAPLISINESIHKNQAPMSTQIY